MQCRDNRYGPHICQLTARERGGYVQHQRHSNKRCIWRHWPAERHSYTHVGLHTTHVWHSYARSTPCFKKAMTFLFLITLTKWNDFNNFCHVESFQKLSSLHRRSWLCSILLWNVGILRNTSKVVVARNNSDNNRLNKLSLRGRRDDIPLADGSSTRGGSTSVRPRTGPQSAHGYAAGSRRA